MKKKNYVTNKKCIYSQKFLKEKIKLIYSESIKHKTNL